MIISINPEDLKIISDLERKFPNIFFKNDIKSDFQNNPYTKYLGYLINDELVGFINY